jgi:transcriptional regulator with XRE-family HTH domain
VANDICVRFGRRLRILRSNRGITQQQLADLTGIGRVHVCELENGKREAGMRVVEMLANSFGMTVAELLKGV